MKKYAWLAAAMVCFPITVLADEPAVQPTVAHVPATQPTTQPVARISFEKYVTEQMSIIQKDAAISHEYSAALDKVDVILQQAIAYDNDLGAATMIDIVYTRRLLRQFDSLQSQNAENIDDLWKLFADHPALARTFVFGIRSGDEIDRAYAILWQLHKTYDKKVIDFANLATAICVVHDRRLTMRINENPVTASDPSVIFKFYVDNEKRMLSNLRKMPPDLLVYMVDDCASIPEMQWALDKYAKDPELGKRYFEIKYDTSHYLNGTTKKITELGFNLQNILKYGGICADQAYFSSTVGKSIGIPTVYITARSGEVGHAWIGYLANVGDRVFWNLNAGRYEDYKNIRGNVIDPQTRRVIGDGYISLTAELQFVKENDRFAAIAMGEAENYLLTLEKSKQAFEPPAPANCSNLKAKPRTNTSEVQVALLEKSLKFNIACIPAWNGLIELADMHKLTMAQKREWSSAVIKSCSSKYPDFTFDVLEPMVSTIEDLKDQQSIWNNAFKIFQNRMDIAAGIRLKQAAIWEKLNDPDKAGQCYEEILTKFPNAGPFVLPALEKAEEKLVQLDRKRDIPTLYAQTWARIPQPRSGRSDLMRSSNWYKVGKAYTEKLTAAGLDAEADKVRQKLPNVEKPQN